MHSTPPSAHSPPFQPRPAPGSGPRPTCSPRSAHLSCFLPLATTGRSTLHYPLMRRLLTLYLLMFRIRCPELFVFVSIIVSCLVSPPFSSFLSAKVVKRKRLRISTIRRRVQQSFFFCFQRCVKKKKGCVYQQLVRHSRRYHHGVFKKIRGVDTTTEHRRKNVSCAIFELRLNFLSTVTWLSLSFSRTRVPSHFRAWHSSRSKWPYYYQQHSSAGRARGP
jgi:hypothetical protein